MNRLLPWLEHLERRADVIRYRLRDRWDRRPVWIHAYRGYGTPVEVHVLARALRNRLPPPPRDNDTAWRNAWAMLRRFESDEVPGAAVRVSLQGRSVDVVADDEGYVRARLTLPEPLPGDRSWHEATLEPAGGGTPTTGRVLVPPPSARLGIISDLDDTVLQTGATRFRTMARRTLFGNARTRRPFDGVGVFYQALHNGPGGREANSLFYVSSSPWNLYDFLVDFLRHHGIPDGPLFLRDLGLSRTQVGAGRHETHKLAWIRRLLHTYPDLPFLLIGDSGQKDPEIYRDVVHGFPGRIRAVYIRDVSGAERDAAVQALAAEVHRQGVDLILAPTTEVMAAHAAQAGLVAPDAVDQVRAAVSGLD
ncbi:hypothetical protein AWN76_015265 [Rhodothermaceae bacterium RA]|nr:hypothetical protein AWN76_015265 [Rhodothermaceae bacterium RA]